MLEYNELKVGTIFEKDGDPWKVIDYAFIRMQQRKPVVQLKIKHLISGKVVDFSTHTGEKYNEAEINMVPVNFIYQSKGEYWFNEVGKPAVRFALKKDLVEGVEYLKSNTEVKAYKFGEKIINIELPIKVDLKITETPGGAKGNTAQGGTKVATLETGAKVNVPLFVNEGDVVRVNTQSGEYIERVEKN